MSYAPATWQQESATRWTASVDGAVVATITYGRQYELVSADGGVRGSHTTLGSAQAQFGAWCQWRSDQPDA